jgi:hypothetical protein
MANYIITDIKNHNQASELFPEYKIIDGLTGDALILKKGEVVIIDGNNSDNNIEKLLKLTSNGGTVRFTGEAIDWDEDWLVITSILQSAKEWQLLKTPEDDFLGADPSLAPTPLSEEEKEIQKFNLDADYMDIIPLSQQTQILKPILNRGVIGNNIAELSAIVVKICKDNKLFMRDIMTGKISSVFTGDAEKLIDRDTAETIFTTHFIDKLKIRTLKGTDGDSSYSYKPIKPNELKIVWKNVLNLSTYNSRIELYKRIPEWDGVERIKTFLKDQYECYDNPNFFLLFLTAIIGKLLDPKNNHCPHYFDFFSTAKGTGKTTLPQLLLSHGLGVEKGRFSGEIHYGGSNGRGMQDFLVDIYDGNNIIAVNDELKWKMDIDTFKSFITSNIDKFSRKHAQPEEHYRSFIVMQTCNTIPYVWDVSERRQIIFKIGLKNNQCRTWGLPPEYWQQLLAEAKVYHSKYGVYKLTDDDWKEIKDNNLQNFDYSTKECQLVLKYIDFIRLNKDKGFKPAADKYKSELWGDYAGMCEWYESDKGIKKEPMPRRTFWGIIHSLGENPIFAVCDWQDMPLKNERRCPTKVFRIDPLPKSEEEKQAEELADMPY